jgi:hypothetical protein
MATQVDSIQIPTEFVVLASHWYYGQSDMLYAVSSTGNLNLGNRRPYNDDEGRPCTDLEWYRSIWSELSCDISYCLRKMPVDHEDHEEMTRFSEFVSDIVDRLDQELS